MTTIAIAYVAGLLTGLVVAGLVVLWALAEFDAALERDAKPDASHMEDWP